MAIHSTALISKDAILGEAIEIGPYTIIDDGVEIGAHTKIGAFCHVYTGSQIGSYVQIFDNAQIGGKPQDLKYRDELTSTYIGDYTVIREMVTIHRGTIAAGTTHIGSHCLIMALCHVAHDCHIADDCQIANSVQLGGHVSIGKGTVIGGLTGIHQFTTIGAGVYIAGGVRVARDILPFSRAMGEPLCFAGLNSQVLKKWDAQILTGELHHFYTELRKTDSSNRDKWKIAAMGLSQIGQFYQNFFAHQTRPILWPGPAEEL